MRANLLVLLLCFWLFPLEANAAAIHDAVKKGDIAGIAAAIAAGADVNESDGLVIPLYLSAIRGNAEAVKLLIERGADVNLPTEFGMPLHGAATTGCLDCVKLLVEAGADVNAITPYREPAIHLATKFGFSDIADYLLKHGYVVPVPPPISAKLKSADPLKGKTLFLKGCAECHDAAADMRIRVGPPLWGIVGRPKASNAKFKYSPSLMKAGGKWDYEELNGFIADPRRVIPGLLMAAKGYQDLEDRADLIAYLRTLSDNPESLPAE